MVTNPERTVFGVKRLIGRKAAAPEVQALASRLPYKIVAAKNGDAWVEIAGTPRSPQEVSAHVLAKMKRVAEDYLGQTVTEAVVTVPAYFDDAQRQATKDAGKIAGLTVRAILNEPTAAALAYGIHHQHNQRLAVFDLGGGTFDISILAIENGVFEVLSTYGDTTLGGDDFDRVVIDLLADEFRDAQALELRNDTVALQRLKEAAERAKIELSSAMQTDVNLPFIAAGQAGPLHLMRELERGQLERACKQLLDRLEAPCQRALADAHCTPSDIDQVLLVGGMTRMPAVRREIARVTGREPHVIPNPEEVVAVGAALEVARLEGTIEGVLLIDVAARGLCVSMGEGDCEAVIAQSSVVPTREHRVFGTKQADQRRIEFDVWEGESPDPAHNRHLGRYAVLDLPPAPAGDVLVLVEMTIDTDGTVRLGASELVSGERLQLEQMYHAGLARTEVARLQRQLEEAAQ